MAFFLSLLSQNGVKDKKFGNYCVNFEHTYYILCIYCYASVILYV